MKTYRTTTSRFSLHSVSKLRLFIIFLLLRLPVVAQEIQPEIRRLTIGETTERQVSAEEELHVYAVEMKRGQVLRVSFQEKGADVTAVIIRASDQQRASATTNYGMGFMQESLTLIADQDRVYWLVVKAQRITRSNIEASYEFSSALRTTSSPNDVQRVKAETLMEEGSRLLEGKDKTSASLAVPKFEQSIKIWDLLGDGYWAEAAKTSMATAFFQAGDFVKAEFYLHQVLRAYSNSKNAPGIAMISTGLAGLYAASKNEKAASQYLETAIEISRQLGDKRAESLLALVQMSILASKIDSRDLDRDLAAARTKDDKLAEASVWAKTLFHYVIEEDSIKDEEKRAFFEKAEREALPLLELVRNRHLELQILLGLGIGFHDLTLGPNRDNARNVSNRKKSLNYISHTIVLAKAQNNILVQSLAYDYLNVIYKHDNDKLAIFFGKKSINSLQDLRQDLRLFDKEDQQDAVRKLNETYGSLASDLFLEGRLAEAHQVLNFSRDQEFFDLYLNRSQELSKLSLTSREMENEQLFNGALENIAKHTDADYRLAGEELKLVLAKLEKNFSAPSSERDTSSNVADTTDMQLALRELTSKATKKYAAIYIVKNVGEILLITPDGVFAFASRKRYEERDTSVEIDEYILDFLHVLRSPNLDPRPLGAQIYNKIFQTKELVNGKFTQTTLEEKLKRPKPDILLWSLSGNLRYVPIAALYDSTTGQYLAEKYQNAVFTRARKERFLVEPKAWIRNLGFGTSLRYGDLSPLPNVPNEISKIFGNSGTKEKGFFEGQVFLNRAFTRQAMLANLKSQPGLVHIASHFIFQPGDSRNSFLLLGDGSKFSLLEMQQTPNLFAGVDLLTLSACETAAQKPGAGGKEVDGFAELAQRLGASSVIATLWRIADDGTSTFMTEFYRFRAANPGAPKSEILQQAQLSLLYGKSRKSNRGGARGPAGILGLKETLTEIPFNPRAEARLEHPYYWAPFVLFGSSR